MFYGMPFLTGKVSKMNSTDTNAARHNCMARCVEYNDVILRDVLYDIA